MERLQSEMEERKKSALRSRAQELRRNATKEENHLWYDFLRRYPIQFRRQKVFGRFIVDFYCAKANLVVEIDGSQHYEEDGMAYDRERTAYLNGLGLEVIRFSNRDVNERFQAVCQMIDLEVMKRANL